MIKRIIRELFRLLPLGCLMVMLIIMHSMGVFVPIEYGTNQGGMVLSIGVTIIFCIFFILLFIRNKINNN